MKICFLIHHHTPLAQVTNALVLANASVELKHQVSLAFSDSLAYHHGDIQARAMRLNAVLPRDVALNTANFVDTKLSGFDIVWLLNFGKRDTFLDRMQLLRLLSNNIRVINSLEALLFLHSKISLPSVDGLMQYPQSHVSSDAETLWNIVKDSNAEWIIKPVAESFGRKVLRLKPGDTNIKPLLQAMTGNNGNRFCLLQRYLPEVAKSEKRVLLAGGEVVGQYMRKAAPADHRANVQQAAEVSLCELTQEERAACKRVAGYLMEQGVYFAGLDIAWPWLIEWNVVNPGGITTIEKLGGGNLAKTVVEKVLAAANINQKSENEKPVVASPPGAQPAVPAEPPVDPVEVHASNAIRKASSRNAGF